VLNALVLRPLKVPHPESLFMLERALGAGTSPAQAYPDYLDLGQQNRSFESLQHCRPRRARLKTTALAPIASASVSTAITANPGALRNCRKASRKSAFLLPLVLQSASRLFRLSARTISEVYARSRASVPFAADSRKRIAL
jgi:hypothetical protein